MEDRQYFAVGDWVKGKSKSGELIRGFIISIDSLAGLVKVNVVNCDNDDTVGRTVQTLTKWVEKLPESQWDEEQILQMLDLALLTGDEPWFQDLSVKLNALRQGKNNNSIKFKWNPTLKNRLRGLGIGE